MICSGRLLVVLHELGAAVRFRPNSKLQDTDLARAPDRQRFGSRPHTGRPRRHPGRLEVVGLEPIAAVRAGGAAGLGPRRSEPSVRRPEADRCRPPGLSQRSPGHRSGSGRSTASRIWSCSSSTPSPVSELVSTTGLPSRTRHGVALHHAEVRADVLCDVDLVDHQDVALGDARTPLARHLLALRTCRARRRRRRPATGENVSVRLSPPDS